MKDHLPDVIPHGYLANDKRNMDEFEQSFRANYPDLVKDRHVHIVDCTQFTRDPNSDKTLNGHRGTHHQTMTDLLNAPNFVEVNEPLGDLVLGEKNLVIVVCIVGRHRSVAENAMNIPVIVEFYMMEISRRLRE